MNSMEWINFRRRFRYLLDFLRLRGVRATLRYLWFYFVYGTDSIRQNRFLSWLVNSEAYPRMIEVETTTACNLRCRMCEHTYWNYPARNMTLDEFKRIINQFPDLWWIGMTGIGSSFLNRDFIEMLAYVKQRGVIVEMFDHFNDLTPPLIERLVKLGVERLWASVDACTKDVYEAIRVGGSFENVTRNLRELVAAKQRLKMKFPALSFQFIVLRSNLHQVPDFVDFVQDVTQGDNFGIRFTPLISDFPEVRDMDAWLDETVRGETERRARRHGMLLMWNKIRQADQLPMSLCTEWTQPFFFVDGSVIPCCASNEHNQREAQIRMALGNVFKDPFPVIWEGEPYRQLRMALKRGDMPPACVQCPIYRKPSTKTR